MELIGIGHRVVLNSLQMRLILLTIGRDLMSLKLELIFYGPKV
jgi:hypothetical protein